jgi:dinuclear metal center YbgI/SA1388 family protein
MYLEEIETILKNRISPKCYQMDSEIYGFHYNRSNGEKIVKKIMITVDLSLETIHCAIKSKANLIISHHGLFQKTLRNFDPHLINKLSLLSRYPISIYILNTPFIAAEGGISETIMEAMYLKLERPLNIKNSKGIKIPIGRICYPEMYPGKQGKMNLETLLKRMKVNLNMKSIPYVGTLNKEINRIGIVGGSYVNEYLIRKIVRKGCDCYISFNIDHHLASLARDIGLVLIEASHYNSEIIALRKLCNYFSLEFPHTEFILFESKNPINFFA